MDKLANMQAFAMVAQTGSFAAAARRLNLANSVVSKRVGDLENHLGVQLLMRTTRKVSLTDTGYGYLEYVRKALDDMAEIESVIRHRAHKPVGTLKISAPAHLELGAAIAAYLERYPEVSVRLHVSDRHVDLAADGFDLAIRIGTLQDSSLIARKLGGCRRVACASPLYLEKHEYPEKPADLASHNCLSYLNLAEGKVWPFHDPETARKIMQPVTGTFLSDNGALLYEAALAHAGITLLPTFIAGPAINDGRLRIVLENYEDKDFDIYAVYQNTRHLSPKIRTMIDHLAGYFARGFIH